MASRILFSTIRLLLVLIPLATAPPMAAAPRALPEGQLPNDVRLAVRWLMAKGR